MSIEETMILSGKGLVVKARKIFRRSSHDYQKRKTIVVDGCFADQR